MSPKQDKSLKQLEKKTSLGRKKKSNIDNSDKSYKSDRCIIAKEPVSFTDDDRKTEVEHQEQEDNTTEVQDNTTEVEHQEQEDNKTEVQDNTTEVQDNKTEVEQQDNKAEVQDITTTEVEQQEEDRKASNKFFNERHQDLIDLVNQAEQCFWTADEVSLNRDLADWKNLKEPEKHFIKTVLGFFAASDGIVNANLVERFLKDIDELESLTGESFNEARYFYTFQIAMENIHSTMYSMFIDALILDANEKTRLFNSIENEECIKRKAEWAIKWINNDTASFGERLLAFAIVEGIFFSGSFASIGWLKNRSIMSGLCFSNELISRDEGLHTLFACALYRNYLPQSIKPSPDRATEILKEAVEVEKYFFNTAISVNLIGMNAKLMEQYIEYVSDCLLEDLGLERIYNKENPFPFMHNIEAAGKTNFFEKQVPDYRKIRVHI